jgi:acetyltransferase EpsM
MKVGGIYDDNVANHGKLVLDVPVRASLADAPASSPWVYAIGQNEARRAILAKHPTRKFATVIHPTALVAPDAEIGEGCTIEKHSVVGPGVRLGRCCIVCHRAVIEEQSILGDFVFVGSGSITGPRASIDEAAVIGMGALVLPGLRVRQGSTVGIGSIVTQDTLPSVSLLGAPAQIVGKATKTRLG